MLRALETHELFSNGYIRLHMADNMLATALYNAKLLGKPRSSSRMAHTKSSPVNEELGLMDLVSWRAGSCGSVQIDVKDSLPVP